MRTVQIRGYGGPDVLHVVTTDTPEPGPGEVRIAVAAAALNPIDASLRSGDFAAYVGEPVLVGFGWDVCGTIDAVGSGVAKPAVGDAVVALLDKLVVLSGTHASHVIVGADAVAVAPTAVDATHAATLPLNSLTADQALDLLDLPAGASLVVTGAAGGVGEYALRLALRRGLSVIAVASGSDETTLTKAGAAHFVDRTADLAGAVRAHLPGGADGLLDTAKIGAPAIGAVRDGGRFANMTPQVPLTERDIAVLSFGVHHDGARLGELARGVDEGWLHTRVGAIYPLDEVAEAHARLAKSGLRGRIVLVP
jgi:NADPH2:quinone reductase